MFISMMEKVQQIIQGVSPSDDELNQLIETFFENIFEMLILKKSKNETVDNGNKRNYTKKVEYAQPKFK